MRKELLAATALSSATLVAWSPAGAQTYSWAGAHLAGSIGVDAAPGGGTFAYPSGSSNSIFFQNGTPYINSSAPTYAPWPTSFGLGSGRLVGTLAYGRDIQAGNIVYGLEGDASALIGSQSWRWSLEEPTVSPTRHSTMTAQGGADFLFTLRPRVGIAVNRLMFYGTGGLAVGHASFSTTAHLAQDSGKGADWTGSAQDWRAGVTVGGGVEYALSPRTSLRFQGLYYNLGKMNVAAAGTPFGGPTTADPYNAKLNVTGTLLTAGINARF